MTPLANPSASLASYTGFSGMWELLSVMSLSPLYLDYCSVVWDPHHKTYKDKLERVQSFAARVVFNNRTNAPEKLKPALDWPSLECMRHYQKLCLCRRIVEGYSIIPPLPPKASSFLLFPS